MPPRQSTAGTSQKVRSRPSDVQRAYLTSVKDKQQIPFLPLQNALLQIDRLYANDSLSGRSTACQTATTIPPGHRRIAGNQAIPGQHEAFAAEAAIYAPRECHALNGSPG